MNVQFPVGAALPNGFQSLAGRWAAVDDHEIAPARLWIEHSRNLCEIEDEECLMPDRWHWEDK